MARIFGAPELFQRKCGFQGIHGSEVWKQTPLDHAGQMHDIAEELHFHILGDLNTGRFPEMRPISLRPKSTNIRCSAVSFIRKQVCRRWPYPFHP